MPAARVSRVVAGAVVILAAVVAAGVFFAFRFVEGERQRDLQAWQIRLGIVADSRAAAVDDWLEQNFAVLRELAQNASLQLYMTELSLAQGDKSQVTDEPAQAQYLRNLLVATSERTGFAAPPGPEVAANVERAGVAGIGLVAAGGRPLVATPGMPPVAGEIRNAVIKALAGKPILIDLYRGAGNQPTLGFVLPVFAIQADQEGSQGIGAVVGVRVVGEDLYARLKQPGETAKTAESYLVRKAGNLVEYLTPLADRTEPLRRSLALDTPDLADAFAVANPGGFAVKRDYAGEEALVTSRPLAQAPWVLVRKISRAEALTSTETRLRTILIVFILIIVGVVIAMIAVWRHGTSLRAAEAAERFRVSSERFENLTKFMRVVTDSQPTAIVAVDAEGRYTFANLTAANEAGVHPRDMIGKNMSSVMGTARAAPLLEINKEVFKENKGTSRITTFDGEGSERVVRSNHILLRGDRDHPPGVLMVIDDITELTKERRRGEQRLMQLINTLVSVVDRRDPYSAFHSSRVAEVAAAVAAEMGVTPLELKTVEIAGRLMNLGKIFIPTELLTKTGKLSEDERELLARSFVVSAELLDGVDFEGPVVDTIRQIGEAWDGSGPLGVKGEDILRTARVVAVANAFVGMISPRAYREAMTFEKVSTILLEQSGTKFDRKAVSALINYLENRGGAEKWAHFRDKPAEAAQ
jgi:PAS domain S-box-containing protein